MADYLIVNDQKISLDEIGFLANVNEWNHDIAKAFAELEGIELTDEHWEVLKVLRDFYEAYEISPAMRILVKEVKKQLGNDKGNSIYLLKLFPESPARRASRIAGLPKPTNCL
ncbi:TusE/DsrC/DsvC family sulfur relay protein [Sessilibacter sp. MAH2]